MKLFTNSTTYKNTKHECMHSITINAQHAYYYAVHILKQRWADINKPEVEDVIGKSAVWAYCYAYYVLNKRWADINKPEVEDLIKKSSYSQLYKKRYSNENIS